VKVEFLQLGKQNHPADLQQGDAAEPSAWWDGRPYDRILLDVRIG